jgi:hypothetical protein
MKRNREPNGVGPETSERPDIQPERLGPRSMLAIPDAAKMSPHRGYYFPTCPVCAESMVAAIASYLHDNTINYLWACDICGYGLVSQHSIPPSWVGRKRRRDAVHFAAGTIARQCD